MLLKLKIGILVFAMTLVLLLTGQSQPNMISDPWEENNLATTHPKQADDLTRKLRSWLTENVDKRYWPKLNPDYQPEKEMRKQDFVNLLEMYGKN